MSRQSLGERISSHGVRLTPSDRRVVDYLISNRERALFASAAEMAKATGTSDATVIRAVRKLGYGGLDALRQEVAEDLRQELTLADRMSNELAKTGGGSRSVLAVAIATLRASLDAIEVISDGDIEYVVRTLSQARRIHAFGIGPSGFIAGYFAAQLVRLGFDAGGLTRTGLQCADDLVGVKAGDAVIALAYDRPYPEVTALFDRVEALGLGSVLVTAVGPRLPDTRAGMTLRVQRGRTDGFGLHAGTLALLEGILIACAAERPDAVSRSLDELNDIRRHLSGDGMGL